MSPGIALLIGSVVTLRPWRFLIATRSWLLRAEMLPTLGKSTSGPVKSPFARATPIRFDACPSRPTSRIDARGTRRRHSTTKDSSWYNVVRLQVRYAGQPECRRENHEEGRSKAVKGLLGAQVGKASRRPQRVHNLLVVEPIKPCPVRQTATARWQAARRV